METYSIYRYALCHILKYRPQLATAIFLKFYDDIDYLFKTDSSTLLQLGLHQDVVNRIKNPDELRKAESDLAWYAREGIQIIDIESPAYPPMLQEIEDRPPLMMIKGREIPDMTNCISIVGTRKATAYGLAACRSLVHRLALLDPKPVIVSGLAFGIDAEAHRAALESGLCTVGVAGTGPEREYPAANRRLYREVQAAGAVLWEFDKDTECISFHFLQRNRIIAGISRATIVIESDLKGGSMNTASLAYSYNRNLYALPGRVSDRFSSGCNLLIERKNAEILSSTEALFNSINWPFSDKKSYLCQKKDPGVKHRDPEMEKILESLRDAGFADIFELQKSTGLDMESLSAKLLTLIEEKRIRIDFKNEYSLNEI